MKSVIEEEGTDDDEDDAIKQANEFPEPAVDAMRSQKRYFKCHCNN